MYELIDKVKEINPLVVHYTNEVTINDCANVTLALGASPLMSYSYEEVEEVIGISSAVVINIGTMNSSRLDLFVQAGKAANKYNKPVIFDPVGVFATKTRSEFVNKLLNEVKFDVVKGNVAEIKYICGLDVNGKGVDSFDDVEDISEIVKKAAKRLECVIVATGVIDYVSDGKNVKKIENGTVDVGVLSEPVDISKFNFIRMNKKERWGILTRNDSYLAGKEYIEPKDLTGIPLIMVKRELVKNELGSWFGEYFDGLDIAAGYNLLNNAAILAQNNIGSVLCFDVGADYDNLKFIPLNPEVKTGFVLVWRKNQTLPEAVSEFIKKMKIYIKGIAQDK